MLTSYQTSERNVATIIALTPGLSDAEMTRMARDLRNGFRIELPTGVSIAFTGGEKPFTVWPAKVLGGNHVPAQLLPGTPLPRIPRDQPRVHVHLRMGPPAPAAAGPDGRILVGRIP